jgi:hypothetical protein
MNSALTAARFRKYNTETGYVVEDVEKATVEDHGSITFFDGMWRKGVTLL